MTSSISSSAAHAVIEPAFSEPEKLPARLRAAGHARNQRPRQLVRRGLDMRTKPERSHWLMANA
jgi:hypothetical protein